MAETQVLHSKIAVNTSDIETMETTLIDLTNNVDRLSTEVSNSAVTVNHRLISVDKQMVGDKLVAVTSTDNGYTKVLDNVLTQHTSNDETIASVLGKLVTSVLTLESNGTTCSCASKLTALQTAIVNDLQAIYRKLQTLHPDNDNLPDMSNQPNQANSWYTADVDL